MCLSGPLRLLVAMVVTTSGVVKCWDLAISSDQLESAESSVTIRCTAPEVAECKFSVFDFENKTDGGLLDCKKEQQGKWKDERHYSCVSGASYCGITLSDVDSGRYVVGCLISSQGRGWRFNYTTLYVYNGKLYARNLEAEPLRASPGETKTYECPYHNKQKLDECIFSLPSNPDVDLSQGDNSPSNGRYSYHGAGLQTGDRGECGIRVANVSEEDNGIVWCLVKLNSDTYDVRAVELIVAKPPSSATLSYHQVSENTVLAICSSSASRPVAHIKWVDKAGSTVRDDRTNDRFLGNNTFLWPWDLGTSRQLEIRYVTKEEDEVSCHVSHPLLKSDLIPVGTGEIKYRGINIWWIISFVIAVGNCIFLIAFLLNHAKKRRKWCFSVSAPTNDTALERTT